MTPYIPATPAWFTTPCTVCGIAVRAAKRENLPRVLHRHLTMAHPYAVTEVEPSAAIVDPTLPPTLKRIAILAVHYSGSRKRLGAQYRDLQTAVVPVTFPGESGVAVVKGESVLVYANLGAGQRGYPITKS